MYCGYAQGDNYGKKSLNHYFRHGAHCVYHIYSVLKVLKVEVGFPHYIVFEIFTAVMRAVLTMTNSLNNYFPHGARCVYHIYRVLKLFEMAFFFKF